MNSFISWIGGKNYLKKEIIKRFPPNFKKYVEVFGGAGWVLFQKEPNGYEVYNDFNSDLVNLFKCIKYHTPELQRELKFVLNSREIFEEIKTTYNLKGLTDIQRAVRFFILIRQSYGSKLSDYGCIKKDINLVIKNFEMIQERLSKVIVENKDFQDLIKVYDRDETLFYLDPPYYGAEKFYQVEFSLSDHTRLYDSLKNIKGKFVLSYNDCEYIRELYKDYQVEGISRYNNLTRSTTKDEYKELIIKNY